MTAQYATWTQGPLSLPVVAIALVAVNFGWSTEQPILGATLALTTVLAWMLNPRVTMDAFATGLGTLIVVLISLVVVLLLYAERPFLEKVLFGCGLIALTVCVFRLVQKQPRYGHAGTMGMALIVLIVCGVLPRSPVYPATTIGFSLLALLTLYHENPAEPRWRTNSVRRRVMMGIFLAASSIVCAALVFTLPPLQRKLLSGMHYGTDQRSAFAHHFELGSLSRLMESDRIALRIAPAANSASPPKYLRGTVYRVYQNGTWHAEPRSGKAIPRHPRRLSDLSAPSSWFHVTHLHEREANVFLPAGAARIATASRQLISSPAGRLQSADGKAIQRYSYRLGTRAPRLLGASQARQSLRAVTELSEPGLEDVQIPAELIGALSEVSNNWNLANSAGQTPGLNSSDASSNEYQHRIVREIETRLQTTFRYALNHERLTDKDPVLDFLQDNPVGHCEFFASAAALLARSHDIPARVVGGYLVSEYNAYGDFYTARQRDAHAWVEVWLDGHWQILDATPPGALANLVRQQPDAWQQWREYATHQVDVWLQRYADAAQYVLVFVLICTLAVLRYRDLARLRAQRQHNDSGLKPLPCYENVADWLQRAGWHRKPSETLHHFAQRLLAGSDKTAQAAGNWLLTYAHFRYGGNGNLDDLTQQAEFLTEQLWQNQAQQPSK